MTRYNADLALAESDRPRGKSKDERIPAAKVASYPTEEQIQVAVAQYLDLKLPKSWRWFHPPNGGHRLKSVAGKLKAQGVKPGVPDVVVLRPNGAPIWIELKAFGGVLSVSQRDFRDWAEASQQPYRVCRSVGEVEIFLKDFIARAA
jgi:hypothetical protein